MCHKILFRSNNYYIRRAHENLDFQKLALGIKILLYFEINQYKPLPGLSEYHWKEIKTNFFFRKYQK